MLLVFKWYRIGVLIKNVVLIKEIQYIKYIYVAKDLYRYSVVDN